MEQVGFIQKTTRDHLYAMGSIYVKKEKNRYRVIYNPEVINSFTRTPKFKMPNLFSPLIRPHMNYYATIDLSNAFTHVPLSESFARYFGFEV